MLDINSKDDILLHCIAKEFLADRLGIKPTETNIMRFSNYLVKFVEEIKQENDTLKN